MNARGLYHSAAVIAMAAIWASPSYAQDAGTQDQAAESQGSGFDAIVVTARRVEENLQDVPVAVTALSADALEQQNVNAVSDLQFSVPNLQIKPSTIYPSQVEFVIRGQRQVLFTDENVVTYVNGVPQSTRGLSLYDVESVQALKGPQGTLFGKNSMGGAMVFTTKRPTDALEGELTFELGNYDLRRGQAVVNLPFAEGIALRLAGEIERRDGVFRNFTPGQKDLGDRHNESFRATFLLAPGDGRLENITTFDWKNRNEIPFPAIIEAAPANALGFTGAISLINQQIVTQQSQLGGAQPILRDGFLVRQGNPFVMQAFTGVGTTIGTLPPLFPGAAPIDPISTYGSRVKSWGVANTTTFELTDSLTFKNILGYRHDRAFDHSNAGGEGAYLTDVSGTLSCLFNPTFNFVSGNPAACPPIVPGPFPSYLTNNNINYFNDIDQWSNEVQVIGKFGDLDLIGGFFYSNHDLLYSVNSYFSIGPLSLYDNRATLPIEQARHAQANITTDSYALFAQGTYDLSGVGLDGLRLTAGFRYTWDKRDYRSENFFTTENDQMASFAAGNIAAANCNELNGTLNGVTGVNNGLQCQISGERTYKAPTWTASLEYEAGNDTLLYLATRRGFKSGSANPTTRLLQFAFFGPEKITDYELGLKHQGYLGDVPFRFNLAGFLGEYKDIQTQNIITFCVDTALCAGGATFTDLIINNVGKATIKGFEIDASIKPVGDLTLSLGYSFQDTEYGSGSILPQPTNPALPVFDLNPINFAGGRNLEGLPFAGVAKHTLNTSLVYEPSWVPESFAKPVLSINYSYRGKTPGNATQGIHRTDSFGMLGGRLALNELFGTGFGLAVWAQNLTNEAAEIYCADNLNSIGYATCRYAEPRTYGLSASFSW